MGYKVTRAKGGDTTSTSTAQEASRVISSTPAMLYSCVVFNNGGGAQYYQLHDAAAVPANAVVPVQVINVPPGTTGFFDVALGRPFVNGIVVCNSSTGPTKTLGIADSLFDATLTKNS